MSPTGKAGTIRPDRRAGWPVDLDGQDRASDNSVILEGIERYWASSRWAVINDARRRQRRRQRRILALVALLLAGATVGWAIARSPQPGHAALSSTPAVGTVAQVNLGGTILSTTTLRGDLWVLTCRQHCSGPYSRATRGQLVELSAAGHPITRFAVADPAAVAGGDGSIWVTHFYSGDVSRINPLTGQTTATIHLQLPERVTTNGWRRFEPLGISFGAGRAWISSPFSYVAEIKPSTARLQRMVFTDSTVTSATTAAGLTWVADELDGVGTFAAGNSHVAIHHISWLGQPVDVSTVAYGAGLIWALGSETNYSVSLTSPPTTSVVTTINPHTGRILHQWPVGNTTAMVLADGGAYVGDDRDGRLLRLIPPNHLEVLRGPRAASLTAATAHTLWAIAPAGPIAPGAPPRRLLRIELAQHP